VIHPVPPPSLPSAPILELNCFIEGDDASQVFTVEIANNELICALKDAIKDKKKVALEHVDADALHLWNVSIAMNDKFKKNVSNVLRVEKELSCVDVLSDVFSKVTPREHLHVIIGYVPPSGECEYFVQSDDFRIGIFRSCYPHFE
jgi:hypothetical protein